MSFPSSYNIQSPAEIIAIQPDVPSELRFFQRDSQKLQTIAANINGIETDDYVIILPGNIPTVNMVLSVADVQSSGPSTVIYTIWSNVGNVAPPPPPVLSNVDITGFFLTSNVNVSPSVTATIGDWAVLPGMSSPLISAVGSNLIAAAPIKVSGSYNITFDNFMNSGSRLLTVSKNASPLCVISEQPNANRDIFTCITVPFCTSMVGGDVLTISGAMSENPSGSCNVVQGATSTYVGINITF